MTETTDNLSLFPEVDEQATIKKVTSFFKVTFPKMVRYSGRSITNLQSPVISDMPGVKNVENKADRRIVQRLTAENVVEQTMKALNVCDSISQTIIKKLYLSDHRVYDFQIWKEIGYQERRYYYYKNRALLAFADYYMLDDLHEFQEPKKLQV